MSSRYCWAVQGSAFCYYPSSYASMDEMRAALKDYLIESQEEGSVLLRNENGAPMILSNLPESRIMLRVSISSWWRDSSGTPAGPSCQSPWRPWLRSPHIVRTQEEGSVLLRNENGALPLAPNASVTLFGFAAATPVYHGKGSQEQVHVPFPGEGQALAKHGQGEHQHQKGAQSPPYVCFLHKRSSKFYGTYTSQTNDLDEDLLDVTLAAPTRVVRSFDQLYWVDTSR